MKLSEILNVEDIAQMTYTVLSKACPEADVLLVKRHSFIHYERLWDDMAVFINIGVLPDSLGTDSFSVSTFCNEFEDTRTFKHVEDLVEFVKSADDNHLAFPEYLKASR